MSFELRFRSRILEQRPHLDLSFSLTQILQHLTEFRDSRPVSWHNYDHESDQRMNSQQNRFLTKVPCDHWRNKKFNSVGTVLATGCRLQRANSDLRRGSGSLLLAHPHQHTKVTSGVREPSTHWTTVDCWAVPVRVRALGT